MRYEAELTAGRTLDPIVVWEPHDGPRLTELELKMRQAPYWRGESYLRGCRNTAYFRSVRVDQRLTRTNCCFKANHPSRGVCYGILDSFLVARAYADDSAPVSVFAKVAAWCDVLPRDDVTHLCRCAKLLHPPPEPEFCPVLCIEPFPVTLCVASEADNATIYNVFEMVR